MNISILTLHEANNVGAFLQAYSLQSVLNKLQGVNSVSFIRFPNQGVENSKFLKAIGYIKQREPRKVIYKYRSSKKYAQVAIFLNINKEYFEPNKQYDVIVVGSDEVWNVTSNNFTHHPQYFGKKIKANRIISYAASGNNTVPSELFEEGMDFSSFSAISVRDENTFELVSTVSAVQPEIVCDPTILIEDFDDVIRPVDRSDYILVYSYELGKEEIANIISFAKARKKKLISVGTYNSWCDENIVADPFEFLSWLKAADYVITSTFHGGVLSVKLQKEFAIYTHSKENPINHKIMDFLIRTDLQRRDAAIYSLNEIFKEKVDYVLVNKIIQKFTDHSLQFLKEALNIYD